MHSLQSRERRGTTFLCLSSWNCAQESHIEYFHKKTLEPGLFCKCVFTVTEEIVQCRISHCWEWLLDRKVPVKVLLPVPRSYLTCVTLLAPWALRMENIRNNQFSLLKTWGQLEKNLSSCHLLLSWHSQCLRQDSQILLCMTSYSFL